MRLLKRLSRLEQLAVSLCVILIAVSLGLYSYQKLTTGSSNPLTRLGGDFTLNHVNGPVALTDFRGQVVTLMFGYTSCPDVCPTGLANLTAAISRLSPSEQQQVQPLFISVDPERDELSRLDQYSRYFHPKLLGLTAAPELISPLVRNYGAFYRKVDMPGSALGYSVDHSSRIYLLNRQGEVASLIEHNSPVNTISKALTTLINSNPI